MLSVCSQVVLWLLSSCSQIAVGLLSGLLEGCGFAVILRWRACCSHVALIRKFVQRTFAGLFVFAGGALEKKTAAEQKVIILKLDFSTFFWLRFASPRGVTESAAQNAETYCAHGVWNRPQSMRSVSHTVRSRCGRFQWLPRPRSTHFVVAWSRGGLPEGETPL